MGHLQRDRWTAGQTHRQDLEHHDFDFKMPFYSGRPPATLFRNALTVLESAKYPTIQFRHITSSSGRRVPFVAGTLYRVTMICELEGITLYGQSEFFQMVANGSVTVDSLALSPTPPPTLRMITAAPDMSLLTSVGATTQIRVQGVFSNGTQPELNLQTDGTTYLTSNPAIVTVDTNGIVTAVKDGIAAITASNQGNTAVTIVTFSEGDLGTMVEGFVLDGGVPVVGAMVSAPLQGVSPVLTDPTGLFHLGTVPSPVPSLLGPIFLEVTTSSASHSLR